MKHILIIEDNIDVRENTAEILELADYKVSKAANGKKGVEIAKATLPDLIVCDIMMPELDGYGVLNILSRNPKTVSIPFVFLTAKSENTDFRKGMNLGADDYIIKPFNEIDLLETIEIRLKKSQYKIAKTDKKNNAFAEGVNGLIKNRKKKTYKKKEVLYKEDDYANYLYYIENGAVKCYKTDEFGKNIVNNIYRKDSFIGYLSLLENTEQCESAVAIENTEVLLIPKKDFLEFIQNDKGVALNFIKRLSKNVLQKEKRLLQLAYASVRERVADCLLKQFLMEENETKAKNVKISREDLAEYVGTTKESLIRTLSDFKAENIIKSDGYAITILNIEGLEKIAKGLK